jgi:nucleotide-binding universal stress UspA family protein
MAHTLPLRRIVVGVDGSAASDAAVRWAVGEARLRRAAVHLVCACHPDFRLRAPYAPASWRPPQDECDAAGKEILAEAAEIASHRLPPGRLLSDLASEPPARALLDRTTGAEMLVLGTCRPDRVPGEPPQALGPVARTCLRLAHCPVVVVEPDGQPAGPDATRRRHRALALVGKQPPAPLG